MATPARRSSLLMALGLGLGLVAAVAVTGAGPASRADAAGASMNRQAFQAQMRDLWAGDHIVWTRCFIISAATLPDVLPDTEATRDRLLANQTAIGNAIKPFYGDAAGDALTALLRQHILIAADLVFAAKAGNDAAAADATARWYANADAIATFLHEANPENWPLETLRDLLRSHLTLTLNEAVARLGGNYAGPGGDIEAYDAVHAQVLQLADALSAGIIAQFPQKFAR